ncbi:MAG: Rieske 2Fe-2S domain-containing protein [Solirubrobacteraceae bacterium]
MAAKTARPVCPASELPPGARKVLETAGLQVLVLNCAGELFAIENCCSHEDAPLDEGELDELACSIECCRHGSRFDLRTGRPLSLPAHQPIEVFDVVVDDGTVVVEVE